MLLSIIIPTHDRSDALQNALQSLSIAIGSTNDCEVFVIDDASNPEHQRNNKSHCNDYSYSHIIHEIRQGAAASRNTGIFISQGEWIAFLDDDVIVDADWYVQLKRRIGSLSDTTIGIEGKVVPCGNGIWDTEVENETGKLYLTCNCIYKAAILKKENGFDGKFNGMYPSCEDHELAARMLRWGKIVFDASIFVVHAARCVSLIPYCKNSFIRMKAHLEAEYYFYVKQRDRYHMFRHKASFFGTIKAVCEKHVVTTFKRRCIQSIVLHPLQSLVLFVSCVLEQATAWVLLPLFMSRFIHGKEVFFDADLDFAKTRDFWNFKKNVPYSDFIIKSSKVKSAIFPLLRAPVYSAKPLLGRIRRIVKAETECKCFMRVDDVFLENSNMVFDLCKVFKDHNTPFCAAIPGHYLIDGIYKHVIDLIVASGGSIAVHGFCHQGMFGPYASELMQMQYEEFEKKTKEVFEAIPKNIKLRILVPPFNAISRYHIQEASKLFKVICGGPETARFTDGCFGPVALANGSWYFPSFFPFYSNAKTVIRSKAMTFLKKTRGIACVTLHMHHEARNGYSDVKQLLGEHSQSISSWETLAS